MNVDRDRRSPSNGKRNPVTFLHQLKKSGDPIVLTINGKTELVVEDAQSYQQLLELVERLDAIAAIREGMQEIAEGKGVSLEKVKAAARKDVPPISSSRRR